MFLFLQMIETEEDKRKFISLYKEYEHLMHWAAYEILKDNYLAEDIVHDVFEKVARNITHIGEPISAKTKRYLYVATRNLAIDYVRKQHTSNHIELVPLDSVEIADEQELPPFQKPKDGSVVIEAVKRLPEIYSTLFMLKYIDDMENWEIAQALGLKEGTIRQRLARGKVLLRKELEKLWKEEEE